MTGPALERSFLPASDGNGDWPWIISSETPAARFPDVTQWPQVSIVTPSFNQAASLEATIRSVLGQGYPNLQYMVIDGGSSDGSLEIIRKYEPWLSFWVSERDRGQAHAINKGFRQATGEIFAYLNSDDLYEPGVIHRAVAEILRREVDILLGAVTVVDANGNFLRRVSPQEGPPFHHYPIFSNGRTASFFFTQPSMFWRRGLWDRLRGLDERYHYVMDREWCARALAAGAAFATVPDDYARFTLHAGSKTHDQNSAFTRERAVMYWRLSRQPGFRPLACRLEGGTEALRAIQTWFLERSEDLSARGRTRLAGAARLSSSVFRRFRLALKSFQFK